MEPGTSSFRPVSCGAMRRAGDTDSSKTGRNVLNASPARTRWIDRPPAVNGMPNRRRGFAQAHAADLAAPRRLALVIGLVGLAITGAVSWTAWTSDRSNEHRLLQVQTQQAGDVIGSALVGIEDPLSTALQIAVATDGDAARFQRQMAPETDPRGEFISATLWLKRDGSLRPIASIPASARPSVPDERRAVAAAFQTTNVVVTGIKTSRRLERIGYAIANHTGSPFAVYAERAIPANRQVPVESGSAFADLNFATYLGTKANLFDLATTNVRPSTLPLPGYTVRDALPFGDTTLTLVTSARGQLGGNLGARLPWILLLGGILLTIATAAVAGRLITRRREAEQSTYELEGLYAQVDTLYGEQRTIAETLQQALLPRTNPTVRNVEIATRYVAGAGGVDIGGDWYSVVLVDDRRFGFVVGDVSGRGIEAATIMARLRFTIRAYLLEGHPPEVILGMCSRQLDVVADGHFATALVGVVDVESGEVVLANAGHLKPLLVRGKTAEFIDTEPGQALGFAPVDYRPATFVMPSGSTLVAFTDGLVERRGEGIDVGLQRMADAATSQTGDPTIEDMLTRLIAGVLPADADGATDDVAVLAFRWEPDPALGGAEGAEATMVA
jgi:serine phosphatase RsbU (regulator of sigma subunit)